MANQMVEARGRRTRWSGLPLGVSQGPPRRYTKDAKTDEYAQGAVGSLKRHSCEDEHSVEVSVSSHSYKRSEGGVRVDGGNDGPTDKNAPDVNDRTKGWNVRISGACQRTDCDQTEGRTGSRSTLHWS